MLECRRFQVMHLVLSFLCCCVVERVFCSVVARSLCCGRGRVAKRRLSAKSDNETHEISQTSALLG